MDPDIEALNRKGTSKRNLYFIDLGCWLLVCHSNFGNQTCCTELRASPQAQQQMASPGQVRKTPQEP